MKLKVSELKKELKAYDQKELIQLVADLFKQNKDVQTYLSIKFMGEEAVDKLFSESAKKIRVEFFPDRGHGKLGLARAKKAFTDFKQITGDEFKTLELMIYYVEMGVEFTNTYGDIDERFYNSIASVYGQVISLCYKNEEYYDAFIDRLKTIVEDSDGIGWGFHDYLSDLYHDLIAE